MHLTRKAIGERIKEIDVVIEMLDARLPGSSANPMLAELIKSKPALKILSKQDLAKSCLLKILSAGLLLISSASIGLALEPGKRASSISMTTSISLMRSPIALRVRCMCPGNH